MRVDLPVQVLAQHRLRQQVGLLAGAPQKAVGRVRWDGLQGRRRDREHGGIWVEARVVVAQRDGAVGKIRGDIHVAGVDDVRAFLWVHADGDGDGLFLGGLFARLSGGGEGELIDARFAKRPGHMRVGVGRQINAGIRRENGFWGAEGGNDIRRNITRALGISHGELHRVRFLRPLHAQAQPHGIESNIFHQRDQLCPIRWRKIRDVDDFPRGGFAQSFGQRWWFQQQPVGEGQVGIGDFANRAQAGFEIVRVLAGWDERGDLRVVPSNLGD